ncbi:hypothetical protein HDV05_006654 [Chytridiales sp. JEL 0842]|nr:hypothetical protein HDV05_006654 [Chytridiales sp. JEL 0842]
MKQRFTALDVAAVIPQLKASLVGLRVQNIYDLNPKTFLFKFAKPDLKELLLIESGIRIHTTTYARDKSSNPSFFAVKLRKHLKSKRLHDIQQLGMDRIMDLQFGENEFGMVTFQNFTSTPKAFVLVKTPKPHHLIIEFYSAGNIILTDHKYEILAILRVVELDVQTATPSSSAAPQPSVPATLTENNPVSSQHQGAKDNEVSFKIGETYPVHLAKPFEEMTKERLANLLNAGLASVVKSAENDNAAAAEEVEEETAPPPPTQPSTSGKGGKSGKGGGKQPAKKKKSAFQHGAKDKTPTLRRLVRETLGPLYGPTLVDHALKVSDLNLDTKLETSAEISNEVLEGVWKGVKDADGIFGSVLKGERLCKGLITFTSHPASNAVALTSNSNDHSSSAAEPSPPQELLTYSDFHPYPFAHLAPHPTPQEFPTFTEAVDTFFTHIETQKLLLRSHQARASAQKKLESTKNNHQKQITSLHSLATQSEVVANAVLHNVELIDMLLVTLRGFLEGGVDWVELWELIQAEKKAGNPVAAVVEGLKLEKGMVTVGLLDPDFEEEEEEEEEEDSDDYSEDEEDVDEEALKEKKRKEGLKRAEREKKRKEKEERRRKATLKVDLDINLTGYANASRYFDRRKTATVNATKTASAVTKALVTTQKKLQKDLDAKLTTPLPRPVRKAHWFEKFYWFVSSENYLVIAGRDSMQTEILLRRYMTPQDVLVHADIDGAVVCIIKNPYTSNTSTSTSSKYPPPPGLNPQTPVPPHTLLQAGTLSLIHSKAWDSKTVISPFWVPASSIKSLGGTAYEILDKVGKDGKRYLGAVGMVWGFGLLFEVTGREVGGERRPWLRGGDAVEEDIEMNRGDEGDGDEGEDAKEEEGGEKDLNELGETERVETITASTEEPTGTEAVDESSKEPEEDTTVDTITESMDTVSIHSSIADGGKKRLSAKQRRDLKKKGIVPTRASLEKVAQKNAQQNDEDENDNDDDANGDNDEDSVSIAPSTASSKKDKNSSATSTSSKPAPRGKRGKLKKMKDKYADQDEDERALMLQVLGSSKGEEKRKEQEAKEKLEREQAEAARLRKKAVAERALARREEKEKEQVKEKGGNDEHGEELKMDLDMFETLTGQPLVGDELVNVIPVCAPWNCLGRYKYKVKLVPGSLKKGKAIHAALSVFKSIATPAKDDTEEAKKAMEAEKALLEGIPEAELMGVMLGKVKVIGGEGGSGGSGVKGKSGKRGKK